MTVPQLYPAQREGVARFLKSKGRYLFTYGTGVGKTPTSIVAMRDWHAAHSRGAQVGQVRLLIVCPAIVRRHWCRQFQEWWGIEARPIEMGRVRRSGSKASLKARDEAYASPIQVVSYDLLSQTSVEGWSGIIFDEIHHLGDLRSRQSQAARALMAANPTTPTIGLSATPIPTRLHQLWHPLYLLFGSTWGSPPRAGSIPWQFVSKWQTVEDNGWGKFPGPAREDRLPQLKARLDAVSHRLTREDIADDLPPVDVRILEIPGTALGGDSRVDTARVVADRAAEWFGGLASDVSHSVILCYHREYAASIVRALTAVLPAECKLFCIDGSTTTASRVEQLRQAEESPSCVVVATSESIREGIRLMWAQRVLYAEWRQSPAQVVQVMGRFQSVGDRRHPMIDVLIDESLRAQASVLRHRITEINGVIEAGITEANIAQVFTEKAMTNERMAALTKAMLSSRTAAPDPEWAEAAEGEEDGW